MQGQPNPLLTQFGLHQRFERCEKKISGSNLEVFSISRDTSMAVNGTLENNGDGLVPAGTTNAAGLNANTAAAQAKKNHAMR